MLNQGFICLGKSMLLEFGFNVSIEFVYGDFVCNFWNINYLIGVFLGGLVVLVVVGVVLVVYVNDGGGFICILVVCCGLVGLKFSWG